MIYQMEYQINNKTIMNVSYDNICEHIENFLNGLNNSSIISVYSHPTYNKSRNGTMNLTLGKDCHFDDDDEYEIKEFFAVQRNLYLLEKTEDRTVSIRTVN